MAISDIAKILKDNDDIVVISHISPDGDAVGSAVAMYLGLKKLGKRVFPLLVDSVPKEYMFLPHANDVCSLDNMPFEPKTALVVDCSEQKRMGKAFDVFSKCKVNCCIDHHGTHRQFAETIFVDGTRASTGEIALELINEMGVQPDKDIAENVLIALATDSGSFQFGETDYRAFETAAECAKLGADVGEVMRRAFRLKTLSKTLLLGEALTKIKTRLDGKIAYTYVDSDMLERNGATLEEASQIANNLSSIDSVLIGVYFEERNDNTKISWRSSRGVNVAKLAESFNGGGHDAAAGANLNMSMAEAIDAVIPATEEYLKAAL